MDAQTAVPGGRDPGERRISRDTSPNQTGPRSVARDTAGDAVGRLLDRLSGVRPTGPGRWIARCPAHEDRSPSLSIRDIDDRVLVHCFAGCGVGDVLSSVGLTLADLYGSSGLPAKFLKRPDNLLPKLPKPPFRQFWQSPRWAFPKNQGARPRIERFPKATDRISPVRCPAAPAQPACISGRPPAKPRTGTAPGSR